MTIRYEYQFLFSQRRFVMFTVDPHSPAQMIPMANGFRQKKKEERNAVGKYYTPRSNFQYLSGNGTLSGTCVSWWHATTAAARVMIFKSWALSRLVREAFWSSTDMRTNWVTGKYIAGSNRNRSIPFCHIAMGTFRYGNDVVIWNGNWVLNFLGNETLRANMTDDF